MRNENDTSYLSEIIRALKQLGGVGSLTEIQNNIEQRNTMPYIYSNANWKDNVRATIQRHCKETRSYRGAEDLFYSVYGLGEGFWGLKEYKETISQAEINPIEERQLEILENNTALSVTEKETIVLARRGQGVFRDKLIEKYHKCIVTNITDTRLLIASHINLGEVQTITKD